MAQEGWKIEKDETDCEILKPASSSTSSSSPPPVFIEPSQENPVQRLERDEIPPPETNQNVSSFQPPKAEPSPTAKPAGFERRCSSCRKRVGLTGFRCRCGDLFCGRHRYSDTHDCSYDYKAAGREQISKANPVIRAAKIIKI